MLKMLFVLLALITSLSVACVGHATPTNVVTTLSWDAYTNAEGTGFYVYWRKNSTGTTYSNVNRFQIVGVTATSQLISGALPTIRPADLCFVLTVYNSVGSESAYSNEVCGFTGFPTVANPKVQ